MSTAILVLTAALWPPLPPTLPAVIDYYGYSLDLCEQAFAVLADAQSHARLKLKSDPDPWTRQAHESTMRAQAALLPICAEFEALHWVLSHTLEVSVKFPANHPLANVTDPDEGRRILDGWFAEFLKNPDSESIPIRVKTATIHPVPEIAAHARKIMDMIRDYWRGN